MVYVVAIFIAVAVAIFWWEILRACTAFLSWLMPSDGKGELDRLWDEFDDDKLM